MDLLTDAVKQALTKHYARNEAKEQESSHAFVRILIQTNSVPIPITSKKNPKYGFNSLTSIGKSF